MTISTLARLDLRFFGGGSIAAEAAEEEEVRPANKHQIQYRYLPRYI
jgi:hypothetical protein